jgi:two-component system, cell cycle response regulator DivK
MNKQGTSPQPLADYLILLIDDASENLEVLQELLEMNGAEVIIAENGLKGLKQVERRPDIIITDLAMPVMTGVELLNVLKENSETANIPVIVLSAHAMESHKAIAFEAGCHSFLVKPISMQALLGEILNVAEDIKSTSNLDLSS